MGTLHDEKIDRSRSLEGEANFGAMWQLLCNKTMAKLMIFNRIMSCGNVAMVNARNSVLNLWVRMDNLVNAADQEISTMIQIITPYAATRWLKRYNWRGLLIFGTAFWSVWQLMFWLVVFD